MKLKLLSRFATRAVQRQMAWKDKELAKLRDRLHRADREREAAAERHGKQYSDFTDQLVVATDQRDVQTKLAEERLETVRLLEAANEALVVQRDHARKAALNACPIVFENHEVCEEQAARYRIEAEQLERLVRKAAAHEAVCRRAQDVAAEDIAKRQADL